MVCLQALDVHTALVGLAFVLMYCLSTCYQCCGMHCCAIFIEVTALGCAAADA